MIVHPDFLDHWKTKRLVELTGDAASPLLVLRLWAYCQLQRKSAFANMTPARLAGVCRTTQIEGDKLLTFFLDCGFVKWEGESLVVHDWDEVNRMLISAWANGSRGGRPASNKPGANRTETDRKPGENRSTRARVGEEDKIRAGSRPVIDETRAPREPAGSGPLAGGIKEGKLCLVAKSETGDADNRRRQALKSFGSLSKSVAQKLNPDDKA